MGESAVLHARVVELADDVLVWLPLHTTTSGGGGEEEDERAEWGIGRRCSRLSIGADMPVGVRDVRTNLWDKLFVF